MKYPNEKLCLCFYKSFKLFLFISVLFTFSTLAYATDYYVDGISGADGNVGTSIAPWRTIDRAKGSNQGNPNVDPGDTVYVRGGTYTYSASFGIVFNGSDSGSNGSPITYKAYPGETVTLHATNTNMFIVSCASGSSFLTIDGFHFTDTHPQTKLTRAITVSGADNIVVQNCTFSDTYYGFEALQGALSTNITVSGNTFFSNSAPLYLNYIDGIVIKGNTFRYTHEGLKINPHTAGVSAKNISIESNFFYQGGYGLEHSDGSDRSWANAGILIINQQPNNGVTGVKVFNNIFWGNCMAGIKVQRDDVEIYNNVFYRNGYVDNYPNLHSVYTLLSDGGGIRVEGIGSAVTGLLIKNNIFHSNRGNDIYTRGAGGTWTESNNLFNTDPLFFFGDPESTDPTSHNNYSLASNSPAIDQGCQDPSLTDVVNIDFRGYSRKDDGNKNIYDIGAFEYGAVPSAPTGLTIM